MNLMLCGSSGATWDGQLWPIGLFRQLTNISHAYEPRASFHRKTELDNDKEQHATGERFKSSIRMRRLTAIIPDPPLFTPHRAGL